MMSDDDDDDDGDRNKKENVSTFQKFGIYIHKIWIQYTQIAECQFHQEPHCSLCVCR